MVSKIRQIVSLFSVSLFSHAESGFTYIHLYTYMDTYIYIHKLKNIEFMLFLFQCNEKKISPKGLSQSLLGKISSVPQLSQSGRLSIPTQLADEQALSWGHYAKCDVEIFKNFLMADISHQTLTNPPVGCEVQMGPPSTPERQHDTLYTSNIKMSIHYIHLTLKCLQSSNCKPQVGSQGHI